MLTPSVQNAIRNLALVIVDQEVYDHDDADQRDARFQTIERGISAFIDAQLTGKEVIVPELAENDMEEFR